MKNSKAQAQTLLVIIPSVVALIVIGMILTVGMKGMSVIRDQTVTDFSTNRTNQTLTFANNTATALAETRIVPGSEIVYGGGSGAYAKPLSGTNYSISYTSGYIIPLNISPGTTPWWNNSIYNVSYSYYYGSDERNITLKGQEGLKQFSDFQPTFGVITAVLAIMIILGAVFVGLYSKFNL